MSRAPAEFRRVGSICVLATRMIHQTRLRLFNTPQQRAGNADGRPEHSTDTRCLDRLSRESNCLLLWQLNLLLPVESKRQFVAPRGTTHMLRVVAQIAAKPYASV